MAKEIGADRLGDFYTDGKVRSRREWRGLRDTLYDYKCWLGIMGTLAGFIVKPRNIKAMFRYRWMSNYLAVPMMVDRMAAQRARISVFRRAPSVFAS